MAGALQHIRVIDFGQYIAGPLAGMLLADQGADVIRVDPPGGPKWQTPANATWNRGKRSITLDLKQLDDLARARSLIESADVVVENFRPGVMDRLGLGPETMTPSQPRLGLLLDSRVRLRRPSGRHASLRRGCRRGIGHHAPARQLQPPARLHRHPHRVGLWRIPVGGRHRHCPERSGAGRRGAAHRGAPVRQHVPVHRTLRSAGTQRPAIGSDASGVVGRNFPVQ